MGGIARIKRVHNAEGSATLSQLPKRDNKGMDGGDRRRHPRLYGSFPAIVRGVDASGKAFEVKAVVDNISASGLYMRLARHVQRSARIFIVVRLSTTPVGWNLQPSSAALPSLRKRQSVYAWRRIRRYAAWVYSTLMHCLFFRVGHPSGPCVAIRGVVVRTDRQPNDMCGVCVAFTHRRFL
jgi:hypothetical protein